MNIFVYSDESGVFDREHNKYFVFGGLVFLSKDDRDICARKYLHAERIVRTSESISKDSEVKATLISNKMKSKLYRSLNSVHKFGVVIDQSKLSPTIFSDKKTKQRYLDWAYKIAIKRKLESLIRQKLITPSDVERLFFYIDEHTTATNGKYELCEALVQEFKLGTHNWNWSTYYPPLFPKLEEVGLKYCNSKSQTLVRASDIVANKLYYLATQKKCADLISDNFYIWRHP